MFQQELGLPGDIIHAIKMSFGKYRTVTIIIHNRSIVFFETIYKVYRFFFRLNSLPPYSLCLQQDKYIILQTSLHLFNKIVGSLLPK